MLGNNSYDPVRLPTESERIFRPAGYQAQSEHSRNAVSLVCQRQDTTFDRTWHRGFHGFRPVVIVNGIRNRKACGFRQPVIQLLHARIESAHDPLQFGEFLHQFRSEIGFRQASSFMHDSRPDGHPTLPHDF